jgi:hypothetical protein
MSLFKFASDEDSTGSPLFAAMMGAQSLTVHPSLRALDKNFLRPSLDSVGVAAGVGDAIEKATVSEIKKKMIDGAIRDKLHITLNNKVNPSFVGVNKKFLPDRSEVERLLRQGGMDTLEHGKISPIKAIMDARSSGGFVRLPTKSLSPITLAHELGHATSLNKGNAIRNSGLFRHADQMGRKLMRGGSKNAITAALLAGAFDSDDNKKWIIPGGMALATAPVLIEEGIASKRALEALEALKGATPKGLPSSVGEGFLTKAVQENAGKYLRRAWGTYGLSAAGLLAAPLLAIGARKQYDRWAKD